MSTIEMVRTHFKKRGFQEPKSIRVLKGGVVNPAFDVDDKLVVRFNVRDRNQKKFRREQLAYEAVRSLGLPIPLAVDYDDSGFSFDGEILITEKLKGRRVSDDWARMDHTLRADLVVQATEILKTVQRIQFPNFGSLEDPASQFSKWFDYIEAEAAKHLQEALQTKAIAPHRESEIMTALNRARPALDQVKIPKLIHGDFHFGNILADGPRITALIDFEWAFAGDPLCDLRSQTNVRDSAKGAERIVEETYFGTSLLEIAKRDPSAIARLDVAILLNKLELLSVSTKHWLGKVSWGERNHQKISASHDAALERLLKL